LDRGGGGGGDHRCDMLDDARVDESGDCGFVGGDTACDNDEGDFDVGGDGENDDDSDVYSSSGSSPSIWCLLCGAASKTVCCRSVSMRSVQEDVRLRCIPSSFHYAAVMAMRPGGRKPVCRHCVNWRRWSRRESLSGRRHWRKKVHTPLDRYPPLLIELVPAPLVAFL
jgi:hypothetical protein